MISGRIDCSNWQMREFRKTELYGVVYPDGEHGRMGVLGEDGTGVHTRYECRAFPSLAPVCLVAGGWISGNLSLSFLRILHAFPSLLPL